MTSPVRPLRSRLLLPETLPFTDARERRWFYTYRSAGPPHVTTSDSFNRTDSGTIGTADTGESWTSLVGSWGINTNQAYCPSTPSAPFATVPSGVANCTVQVRVAAFPGAALAGVCVRVTDAANWIRMVGNGATLKLQKSVAGTVTTVATVSGLSIGAGSILGARLDGTTIFMLVGGARVGDPQTVEEFVSIANHGICIDAASSAARFDDFRITVP